MTKQYIDVDSEYIGGEDGNEDDFMNEEGENWKLYRLPAKYAVCPSCDGKGSSSGYLGAFTSEEWDEQSEEFHEDYLSGQYDRKCEECNGLRVVLVPDKDDWEFNNDIYRMWEQQQQDKWNEERTRRMESGDYSGYGYY